MADYNSSLPVRSEGDVDEKLQAKIVDATTPSQQMEVDTDGNAHVEVHGNNPTNNDVVLKLSEEGNANGRGDYHATDNTIPNSSGLIAHERNAAKTSAHQIKRVSAIDSSVNNTVTALDVAIRDASGNPFTPNNPMPVSVEESAGDEVVDYNTGVAVAKDATSNHSYTVTASKTLLLDEVLCSASAKTKFALQVETGVASGVFNTVAVAFNSTATPTTRIKLHKRLKVSAGVIVRVARTNIDTNAQDLYTTIIGVEH